MAVTQLPTPPQRSDPATFAERGDAFMSALPTFQAEINALQITTNAQTAADAAASATSAAAAVVAKDAAIAAWAASMSPAETLPALSQSLHIGAVVKAIVYDTSKDSDGGAWRKRCADKSWYTETLGGDRWIGQHATIAAAWTAAGSTTGAVYQASATAGSQTSGLYYTPTSSTTVTQVYRGVTREFPAVAGIVAESARVVIYDLATGAMWMVFTASSANMCRASVTSVAAVNGCVLFGYAAQGISWATFPADTGFCVIASDTRNYISRTIATRNNGSSWGIISLTGIVSNTVNDVAITVLDTAPIDPATGLPVPTIAVATAGGVSVITDSGAVITNASEPVAMNSVGFIKNTSTVFATRDTPATSVICVFASPYASAYTHDATNVPPTLSPVSGTKQLGATAMAASTIAAGNVLGVNVFRENPATPTKGMVAYITDKYSTGHMVGDIRGAYLADTTAETVTASGELVTNGTFDTDTSGWTASQLTGSVATIAVASARLRVTNNAATGRGAAYQTVTTVIGRTYVFSAIGYDGTSGAGNSQVRIGTSNGAFVASGHFTDGVQLTLSFTAPATTTYVTLSNYVETANLYVEFDNISVKLAEPDRSVKNKGLVINGSLTKTAVASGAGLVAWSGFSAANYLEQPYNSDLDFAGDFSVMGWVNMSNISGDNSVLLHRSLNGQLGGLAVWVSITTGLVTVYGSASTSLVAILTSSTGLTVGANTLLTVTRLSGVVNIYFNDVLVGSTANSTNLTYPNAVTKIGVRNDLAAYARASLALWRISATAPSADQIAHAYRTELPLFQASAQCTIAGSSTAVTALAFDDTTELLHVGTSWGRTGFKDLLRVDSEATTTGALTSLSASQGVIITGGTSGKVYVPAMLLRDELRRKDEARKALGKVPVFQEFDAVTSQVAFVVAKGYTVKAVYSAGTLKRIGSTKDYTISDDGFQETITFAVAPGNTVWVSAMTVRK